MVFEVRDKDERLRLESRVISTLSIRRDCLRIPGYRVLAIYTAQSFQLAGQLGVHPEVQIHPDFCRVASATPLRLLRAWMNEDDPLNHSVNGRGRSGRRQHSPNALSAIR